MSKNKKAKLNKNSQMMLNRVKLDSLWLRQVVPLEVNQAANREVKSVNNVHNNSNQDLKNHNNNPKSQEAKDQIIWFTCQLVVLVLRVLQDTNLNHSMQAPIRHNQ